MAYDYRASLNQEFDVARQKARQQEQANVQGQRDALARRQAQLGGGPGGAFIKAEQQVQDQSAERLGQRTSEIDAAQRGEQRRIAEVDEARQFQRGEREASQKFASGEREASQKFARGEREAGQTFSAGEAQKQRGFLTGEREASQTWQAGESQKGRDFADAQAEKNFRFQAWITDLNQALQKEQFGKQMELAWSQFEQEKAVDAFNMDMAEKIFNKKDMLEQAFADIFHGAGIGKSYIGDFRGGRHGGPFSWGAPSGGLGEPSLPGLGGGGFGGGW